jgi:hypothetical protein
MFEDGCDAELSPFRLDEHNPHGSVVDFDVADSVLLHPGSN